MHSYKLPTKDYKFQAKPSCKNQLEFQCIPDDLLFGMHKKALRG